MAQATGRQSMRGRIYLMSEDGKPAAYSVRLGISDGTSTELIVASNAPEDTVLKEGATVITGTVTPGLDRAQQPRPGSAGPRLPF